MKIQSTIVAAPLFALAALAAHAGAQTALPLTNPSFETSNLFNPIEPEGWHNISNPNGARHRFVNDGLTPAVTPRTGNGCIELRAIRTDMGIAVPNSGGFVGFTTDTTNFFDPNFGYYDPFWDYNNPAPVRVTGWYMIPESDPLVGDSACIKVQIKTGNQDVATLENFDSTGANPLSITGHTGGQWRFYEVFFARDVIIASFMADVAPNGCACVPAFPRPNHCKITPARFGPDGVTTSGVIYWDDLTYEQVEPMPEGCRADYNHDGIVEPGDLDDFITAYFSTPQPADTDFNNDGITEPGDLDDFITTYFSPCP